MAKKTEKATHKKKHSTLGKKTTAKAAPKKAAAKVRPKPAKPSKKAAPKVKAKAPKKTAPKPASKRAPPVKKNRAPKATPKPTPPPKAPTVKAPEVPVKAAPAPKAKVAEKSPKKSVPRVSPPVEIEEVDDTEDAAEEIVLTDAEGRRYCRVKDCDQVATVDGYCRFHYLLYWKKIQIRKKILSEGKLERYVEELTARYPDKFLEMLRKDLRSEKEFLAAIQELEIDESATDSEFEDESANYIEEVRGMGDSGGGGRDDEDF